MNKFYNNQEDIASGIREFLKKVFPKISKTVLNILPYILFGMLTSESCSAPDIAKVLKDDFEKNKLDSNIRRIRRFFSNTLFKPYKLYFKIIQYILKSYSKKHKDKRVHIIFDHMFSHDNYAVFMITMRIGKQGVPLWFQCFEGGKKTEAFKLEVLKNGIKNVSNLFQNLDLELIFLADRWFNNTDLLEFINSLGHIYCIRLKGYINVYENGKKLKVKKLKHHKYHSTIHKNIFITDNRYKVTVVYSDSIDTNDPWIIVTNGDPKRAIKDYSYRFGGIECVFKNQKSNGFHLEKISNSNLQSFTTMYTCVCICVLYLTILGADYSKNNSCYKEAKIETHKTYLIDGKRIKKRIMSLFNTGLTLFKLAFNSIKYIRLPFSFKLYDI